MEEHDESDVDIDVFEQPQADQLVSPDTRWAPLPASTMLSTDEADALLRWRKASIITVVGERNGGKTTLVSQLYEQFLRGPFAQTLFSHSWSLQGFEKKNFQSRVRSGGSRPETTRTSVQEGLGFFHLAVSDEASLLRTDLLISERAGETYRDMRDEPERATTLVEIRKASVIVLILDGERVSQVRTRHAVFGSVRSMARALLDSGSINKEARVQLVTTKIDLLSREAAEALAALSEFEAMLTALFRDRFELTSFRISARDPSGDLAPGSGMDELIRSWIVPQSSRAVDEPTIPVLKSEFDLFLVRGRK